MQCVEVRTSGRTDAQDNTARPGPHGSEIREGGCHGFEAHVLEIEKVLVEVNAVDADVSTNDCLAREGLQDGGVVSYKYFTLTRGLCTHNGGNTMKNVVL